MWNCNPSEKDEILKFNQYINSDKMPDIIRADIESLIKKIVGCANSLKTKIGKHIPCEYSMSTIWGFDHIENKHSLYHGKDCMKKFCASWREHSKNIIGFEKKKDTVNKWRIRIIWICQSMLYLWKIFSKNACWRCKSSKSSKSLSLYR